MPHLVPIRYQGQTSLARSKPYIYRAIRLFDLVCCLIWFLFVCNLVAQPALAYVDPGSGLLLLQILGSTIAGATFLIRKRILELFRFFTNKSKED
jgi:hypothetical protein